MLLGVLGALLPSSDAGKPGVAGTLPATELLALVALTLGVTESLPVGVCGWLPLATEPVAEGRLLGGALPFALVVVWGRLTAVGVGGWMFSATDCTDCALA